VWAIYFILLQEGGAALSATLFTSVVSNLFEAREILQRIRIPA
jgi:hypothetical protein